MVHIEATSSAAIIHTFVFIHFLSRLKSAGTYAKARKRKRVHLRGASKSAYPSSGRRRLVQNDALAAGTAKAAPFAEEVEAPPRACSMSRGTRHFVLQQEPHLVKEQALRSSFRLSTVASQEPRATGSTPSPQAPGGNDVRVFDRGLRAGPSAPPGLSRSPTQRWPATGRAQSHGHRSSTRWESAAALFCETPPTTCWREL
jgi:hypothetical protein